VRAALADPRPTLDAARAALQALAPLRGEPVALDDVKDVVLIASSSRGGSSVFTELLRGVPGLSHLQAELNPFVLLAGAGPWESGRGDDQLSADDPVDERVWARELGLDVGAPAWVVGAGPAGGLEPLAGAITARLIVQWPERGLPPAALFSAVRAALDALSAQARGALPAPGPLHRALLDALARRWPGLDPWFYDLAPALLADAGPPPAGPPGRVPIEEPPFVTVGPWRRGLFGPLVIKTPSNCHRLDWLAARFPRARLRVLHLVRNPAAAINGLVDGWLFRGFHSHALAAPLGGALGAALRPGDRGHWKYDLPPGWAALRGAPLPLVAAHQWASAHDAALRWLDAHPEVPRLTVRFEQVVGEEGEQVAALTEVAAFLGLPDPAPLLGQARGALPVVMATAAPRARRWFSRAAALEDALRSPGVQAVVERLQLGDPEEWR
jgi:hypothetical protein